MVYRVLAGYRALSHTQATPAFQKFSLHYFTFVKDLLEPVSLTERKLKRSFAFMKKKANSERGLQSLFCREL